MILRSIDIRDFRCIEQTSLDLARGINLLVGPNGSGKTSLLEAIGFLSRGRSFRGTRTDGLVRHGQRHFLVAAAATRDGIEHRLGIEAGRGHLQIRVDRQPAEGLAQLAETLVVQVIDPEIHRLVSDGPEGRRRFLDYGVFHVEHGFLGAWRRFRRALRQRNAALRQGVESEALRAWEPELAEAAKVVDDCRRRHAEALETEFVAVAGALLAGNVACEYRPGWTEGESLEEALDRTRDRDREQGTTSVGPHRADLRLSFKTRAARQQVSRGQQKLFGAALVLAQTALLSRRLGEAPVLLVDDPAAELDGDSVSRLMEAILETDCQLIVTALSGDALKLPEETRRFHVEHGDVTLEHPA